MVLQLLRFAATSIVTRCNQCVLRFNLPTLILKKQYYLQEKMLKAPWIQTGDESWLQLLSCRDKIDRISQDVKTYPWTAGK